MGADPATMGVKLALMAAQMAMTATTKIEGPRLDSLDVTTADFGTALTYFWGCRRLEGCPIFWAEKLREKKTTSKTKGGKYAEYRYFGTFAVAIADHAIDSVSRIWMDKHLVYDVTKAGPISVGGFFIGLANSPVKITNGRNMRIYTGSQIAPDPRMESWCEDRYGADSCPAYKDVSYIVFQDLPLEKFGNRIPQITVEAINNTEANYLWEAKDAPTTFISPQFTPSFERFYSVGGTAFQCWDVATRTLLSYRTVPSMDWPNAVSDTGIYAMGTGGSDLYRISPDGTADALGVSFATTFTGCRYAGGDILFYPFNHGTYYGMFDGSTAVARFNTTFEPTHFFTTSSNTAVFVGPGGGANTLGIGFVGGAEAILSVSGDGTAYGFDSGDFYIVRQDDFLYQIDRADLTLVATQAVSAANELGASFDNIAPGAASFWNGSREYSSADLSLIRTINTASWPVTGLDGAEFGWLVYDPVNHAMMRSTTVLGPELVWRYLDRVGSGGVTLGDVVSDVAIRCGLTDYDVSDLVQVVEGYSVTQGAGKDMISPLLDIHDVDARPHDFAVQFVNRGDSPAGTIAVSEFVREGDEARYVILIAQDTDIPKQISLSFADSDKDQQTNTVLFQRPNASVDTVRTQQIDLTTYVSIPGDAQKYVDRYGRRKWNGRETISNALTAQYLRLEPGDVWTLALDDVSQSAKLTKLTISQGRLNAEWERDFASLHLLGTGTGAAMDGRDDDAIFVPAPTKGFVVDIPLVQDSDNNTNPLLYYGAGDYGTGDWPGATIYEADANGDEFLAWNGVNSADKAIWGYATDALADADPWLWDRGNTVNIEAHGALTSSTEAAIDANPMLNLALLGDELFNFATATLEADGSYTLSGLKRGRRGTEWACATHDDGDEFVLISSLTADGMGLSDVGTALAFRAQSLGRDVASVASIDIAYAGSTLKPYAPAQLRWTTDGTDLFGEIIRRTRVGGSWVGGTTIPLSEASEAYEVDIYHLTTFKRTITVSGTNSFTYTAAMISADSNSVGTPPPADVYQMSDAVGRGFALAA